MVLAAFGLLLATGAGAREPVYRGILVDADGSQSRFRFTISSCRTEGTSNVCDGRFSRCRTDPCPATKGTSSITFAADGGVTIALQAGGGLLQCTLASAPGAERGTYVCM